MANNLVIVLVVVALGASAAALVLNRFCAPLGRAVDRHLTTPFRSALASRVHVQTMIDLALQIGFLGPAVGAIIGLDSQGAFLLGIALGLFMWLLIIRLARLTAVLEEDEGKSRHRRTAGAMRSIVRDEIAAARRREATEARRLRRRALGYSPARNCTRLNGHRR